MDSIDLLLNTSELFLVLACLTFLLFSIWLLRELFQPWLEARKTSKQVNKLIRKKSFHDEDTTRVAAPW
jgi:hypothetical protein